jgi:tetratricopeptide (TPR) repeat protein
MKTNIIFAMLLTGSIPASAQVSKQIIKMYDEHNYQEVITISRAIDIYNSHSDDKIIYDFTGRSYYALQKYDSAVYFEDKALALDNDASSVSGWGYTFKGMALYRLGNKEEAVKNLQMAITLGKTHNSVEAAGEFLDNIKNNAVPDGKYEYYFSQGEYKNAIKEGRRQLDKQPYKDVMEVVGASYFHIHSYDSAIYFERKAIAADNDATEVSGWAHAYLGMALYQNSNKKEAVKELTKAIALDKTSQSVRKAESFLDEIINDRDLPIDSLHQVIKDELNNGNYSAAAGAALSCIATHPGDALGWDQLATAYCWLHNYDSSLYCAQKAIELDGERTVISCNVHYHMGICRFMKSDREGADAEFTKAINDHISLNMKKKVKRAQTLMGLTDKYNGWKTVERDNIVFHFQSRKNIDDDLMDKYEKEYIKASRVLPVALPKKIDVFVWESQAIDDYQENQEKDLSYTATDYCLVHVAPNNNRSGEILKILSHWQN